MPKAFSLQTGRFISGISSRWGFLPSCVCQAHGVFSPYRALAIVAQVQPRTKAFPCSFELPGHVPHLDWTPVLTLWIVDLTFKATSKENTRSACLVGHQGFSSIILKREHLLRKEIVAIPTKVFPLDPADFTSSWSLGSALTTE